MNAGKKRCQGQERCIDHIDPKKEDHERHIDQIHRKRQQCGQYAKDFNIGGEQFIEQEIEIGDETDRPIFGVGQDILIFRHALEQADVPPAPLPAQIPQTLRHLGPAHRIRDIADAVAPPVLTAVHMEFHHQFHILAHGGVVVASGGNNHTFQEQAERP